MLCRWICPQHLSAADLGGADRGGLNLLEASRYRARLKGRPATRVLALVGCLRLLRCREAVAQRLCRFELYLVAGGDLDRLASPRVAPLAGGGPFALEDAQPAYFNLALGD